MTTIHLTSDNSLGILHRNTTLSFIDFNDNNNHSQGNGCEEECLQRRNGTYFEVLNNRLQRFRETSYDTAKDNQGNSVANSVFSDFFTNPHEEAGACCKYYADKEKEEPAVIHQGSIGAKAIGNPECLDKCQENGEITSHLLDLLKSFLTIFT